MKRTRIISLTVAIYVVMLFMALAGCYSSSQTASKKNDESGAEVKPPINPKIVVYNFSDDSAMAYIKIYASDLLFKKDSSEFLAHVRIQLFTYPGFTSKTFLDSTSITFIQPKIDDDKSRFIVASMFFKKPVMEHYLMKFTIMDLNRSNNQSSYIQCSANDNQNQFSMLMIPYGSQFPSFENYIYSTDSFNLFTKLNQPEHVFVRYFKSKETLAAPPHIITGTQRFSYIGDSTFTAKLNDSTLFNFTENGIYHFQFDTLKKTGYTLFKFNDDFPNVTHAEEMTQPLRYLTTSKEFNSIMSAESRGTALEKFWIEHAGDKDRARKLISAYYGRMEEANRNFTSYTEGWRTDKGMIYMILGQPVRVERYDKKEVWTYSNIAGTGSLNFEFTKMLNPFTENDYILLRSQLYELPWYTAVNTWREGNVFGD